MLQDLHFAREQSALVTRYLLASRVVMAKDAEDVEWLLRERSRQAAVGVNRPSCVIRRGGYVLLDFGAEFQGGVMLTVSAVSGPDTGIRVVFGESVSEAMSDIRGEQGATNDHAIRDSEVPIPVTGLSNFRVGMTGFRFVRLEAVNGDIRFDGVQGAFDYRDIPYKGSFFCSDERLNQIWNTSAYTVHLNMQEYLWDGIKRDRLVWIGDSNPEINSILTVFGYNEVVPKSLDFIRDCTPPTEWMNTIPSYSMWWIVDHWEWYLQTGDRKYLDEQKPYMTELVAQILSYVNDDGTLRMGGAFVDWSSNGTPYMEAGQNAMFVLSLRAAAQIMTVFGEGETAQRCTDAADRIRPHVYAYQGNKQVAALVAMAETVPAEQIDREVLSVGGAQGFSTFLGYYGLLAMAKAGNVSGALHVIRTFWGAMLDLGATTFWEDFDMSWVENAARIDEPVPEGKHDVHAEYGKFCYTRLRHSLCHGWASGPAPFMSRYILGIQVLEPGCKRVAVNPNLCDLAFADGTYPTPYGCIHVHAWKENGERRFSVRAPKEVEIVTDGADRI